MCGRYANHIVDMHNWNDLMQGWPWGGVLGFNIVPGQVIPAFSADGGGCFKWGLVPSWFKGERMQYATFNARIESIESKSSFKGAWNAGRRCLIPALGYYEWRQQSSGKQPYFICGQDEEPLMMAGIWEPADNGVSSCSIITQPASAGLESIHPRMPLLVARETADSWLQDKSPGSALNQLQQLPPAVRYFPVDTKVNNPKNQGAGLIEPVASDDLFL